MSNKHVLPESEFEKSMVTGLLLKLRGLPFEFKNKIRGDNAEWKKTQDNVDTNYIMVFRDCEYRVPTVDPKIPDIVWQVVPDMNYIVINRYGDWLAFAHKPSIELRPNTSGFWASLWGSQSITGTLVDLMPKVDKDNWQDLMFERPDHLKGAKTE